VHEQPAATAARPGDVRERVGRGYLTFPNWAHDRHATHVWPVGWLYAQGKVSDPPRQADVCGGALYAYPGDDRVYHCPLHRDDGDYSPDGTDRLSSNIMNGAVCGYGSVGDRTAARPVWAPSWKVTDWTDASAKILWWEAEEGPRAANNAASAAWNDGASYPRENLLARRHGRGGCVGYFDGHVGWMDRLDYVAELQRPGPNRLYCDPHRGDGGRAL
jgi:hypothetical protein